MFYLASYERKTAFLQGAPLSLINATMFIRRRFAFFTFQLLIRNGEDTQNSYVVHN